MVRELTPRQVEVLACLKKGMSNKEIARDLKLSSHTVSAHIAGLLRTLGVKNRMEAVMVTNQKL